MKTWAYCPECDDFVMVDLAEDETKPLECSECGGDVDPAFDDEDFIK